MSIISKAVRLAAVLSVASAATLLALPTTASAEPASAAACTKATIAAATCLPFWAHPGEDPLTAAARGAIQSGHAELLDKYVANLKTKNKAPKATLDKIERGRVAARTTTSSKSTDQGATVQPRGGSDGVTSRNNWILNDSYPIGPCTEDGCTQIDTLEIHFNVDLSLAQTSILTGYFEPQNGSRYSVVNLHCEAKVNLTLRPDQVRGTYNSCNVQLIDQNRRAMINEGTVAHTKLDEKDYVHITFDFVDPSTGYQGGSVEYESPDFRINAAGDLYFP